MFAEVTQENLPALIPAKAAVITKMLQRNRNLSLKMALLTFYRSHAYRLLEQEKTKLWHLSAAQIYALYFGAKKPKNGYHNGPGHSKLSPYHEQIASWQAQGLSFTEMAKHLAEQGCVTTPQNIWRTLKRSQRACADAASLQIS